MVPIAALLWVVFLDIAPGSAYRFFRSFDEDSLIPHGDAARQWRTTVWGPGDTLVWHVLDDPLWLAHFLGPEEPLPLVEESLDVWARIPSADVRWRVDGIVSGGQVLRDGRNTISLEETEDFAGQARALLSRRRGGPWEIKECDVVLNATGYLETLASDRDNRLNTLIHEFGHCLGLRHAAVTPTIRWDWSWTSSAVWEKDPQMSYGTDIDSALSEDEVISASLLRPVRGWLSTTGRISGRLSLDGGPAAFVSVHVLRNDGGKVRAGVQVFSDEDGEFRVEGLAPEGYLLWVHPMIRQDGHPDLLQVGDPLADLNDLLDGQVLAVRAGQETDAGEFTLSRGRVIP